MIYAVLMISSPTLGLVFGGFLRDNIKTNSILKTLKIIFILNLLGTACTDVMTLPSNRYINIILIWLGVFICNNILHFL
jgi:hypothetical protein